MPGVYLGHLPRQDQLFEYLRWEIFPRFGSDCREGIRVFGTNGSNAVYVYEDRLTNTKVVGKFFLSGGAENMAVARERLDREYNNINEFRKYLGSQHYVAAVLGRNDDLNALLVVEYCFGESLDSVILRSISGNDPGLLYDKLTALAWFLATVHNRSASPGKNVDFNWVSWYFDRIADGLDGVIGSQRRGGLFSLKDRWYHDPVMWQDNEVLVHGDATPSNFFFGNDHHVISFDMERVKRTDRMFDTGRIAGELQHFFLRTTGSKYDAEPFIGHFLWEYACHFPDRESAFRSLTARLPFYMGTTLLRIARNAYLEKEYRRRLVREAELCLGGK